MGNSSLIYYFKMQKRQKEWTRDKDDEFYRPGLLGLRMYPQKTYRVDNPDYTKVIFDAGS